ncbi:MAG TPA: hypothetical protein VGO93_09295 [Candidatus Xenobia bacterium]|jgi:hypothetical protein
MEYYRAFGLVFASEIPLADFLPTPPAPPAVTIRRAPLAPLQRDTPGVLSHSDGPLFLADETAFRLHVAEVASYAVENGCSIWVDACAGATGVQVGLFLRACCLGALLHQRGILTLHASAIETPHGAVLFAGQSGAGKSTLLGTFLGRGYRMLADDMTAVTVAENGLPLVHPAFPRTRLCPDSARYLGHEVGCLGDSKKLEVSHPHAFAASATPAQRIFFLSPAHCDGIEVEDLARVRRFHAILSQTYRTEYMRGLRQKSAHFRVAAALAADVPMHRIRRSTQVFDPQSLADRIEEKLQEVCPCPL